MFTQTLTEADRVAVCWLMRGQGIPRCALSGLLSALEVGAWRGERDALRTLDSFRRKAAADPGATLLMEVFENADAVDRLDEVARRGVDFLRSVLRDVPTSEFAARVRLGSTVAAAA